MTLVRRKRAPWVMPLSMDCASGASPERMARIAAEERESILGSVVNLDLTTTCPFWPVTDLGDEYRSRIESNVPVLAVSGTLDLRTPPSNVEEVLEGLENGAHLLIVGGGHGDDLLIGTPEIAAAIVRFLETGDAGVEEIVLDPL